MAARPAYASFLLRMWSDDLPDPPTTGDWESEIRHLQSGHAWTFDNLDDLVDFLTRQAVDPDSLAGDDPGA